MHFKVKRARLGPFFIANVRILRTLCYSGKLSI